MTTGDKEKVAAKIRALFAKTEERGATPEEAAAAAAKATELITRYNLTLSDLEIQDEGAYVRAQVHFTCPAKLLEVHQILLQVLSGANFCRSIADGAGRPLSVIIGRPENIEFVTWLYGAVQDDLSRLGKTWLKSDTGARVRSTTRRHFMWGAIHTIKDRLDEQRRSMEREKNSGVTALVLVTKDALDKATRALVGNVTSEAARPPRKPSMAYLAGLVAGKEVNLNRPLGGKS